MASIGLQIPNHDKTDGEGFSEAAQGVSQLEEIGERKEAMKRRKLVLEEFGVQDSERRN